jgi:hypothetical protein
MTVVLVVGGMILVGAMMLAGFALIAWLGALFVDFFRSSNTSRLPQVPPQELWQQCPTCRGHGGACSTCGGTGRIWPSG